VPSGSPVLLVPQKMRNFDEVAKGLGEIMNLWNTMANEDDFGKFRRKNEPLNFYWRTVRLAMASPILVTGTLQYRFWPFSRFGPCC
jgi:hypothetical protein